MRIRIIVWLCEGSCFYVDEFKNKEKGKVWVCKLKFCEFLVLLLIIE